MPALILIRSFTECSVERDSEVALGSVVGTPGPVVLPAGSPGGRSGSLYCGIGGARLWKPLYSDFSGLIEVKKQEV